MTRSRTASASVSGSPHADAPAAARGISAGAAAGVSAGVSAAVSFAGLLAWPLVAQLFTGLRGGAVLKQTGFLASGGPAFGTGSERDVLLARA